MNDAPDSKDIADLTARINAEQAMLTNEGNKLIALNQARESFWETRKQQGYELRKKSPWNSLPLTFRKKMNIKNIIVITGLVILATGCFEDDVEVINPQSMEECIPINNANKRDQCKMQVTAFLKNKGIELRKKTTGSPYH